MSTLTTHDMTTVVKVVEISSCLENLLQEELSKLIVLHTKINL